MVHGSIRLEEGDGFVHLHTTHDGQFGDRLETVLYLPHFLFLNGHRRRYWPIERLMVHDGYPPEYEKGEPKSADFERIYKGLKRMARSFNTDIHSMSEHLTRARNEYLFVVASESVEQSSLDYWGYDDDIMTVRCNEPEFDSFVLDIEPEIEYCIPHNKEEEVLEDLAERVDQINEELGADLYEQSSDTEVIIPMKRVIAVLVTRRLAGNLFVPEGCRWMKREWDEHFFDGKNIDYYISSLP